MDMKCEIAGKNGFCIGNKRKIEGKFIMYKFGRILIALLPMIIAVLLQNVCYMFFMMRDGMNGMDISQLAADAEYQAQLSMNALCAYAVIGIFLFGLWYLVGARTTRYQQERPLFSGMTFFAILLGGISLQVLISCALTYAYDLIPDIMERYSKDLIESGIGQWNLLSFACTVFLAPIVEEFAFRGMTIHFLKKASLNFYMVNLLQAFFFGIFHMNLVQGIYAGLIGLLLGYLYYKYNSILIPILVHMIINLSGVFLNQFADRIPEGINNLPTLSISFGVLFIIGMVLFIKDKDKIDTMAYDYR